MNGIASDPAVTMTIIGLIITGMASFISWFVRRLITRVEALEKIVAHKVDTAILNDTANSLRRKTDEVAERTASQMTALERELTSRQQELLLSLTKHIQDAIHKGGQR